MFSKSKNENSKEGIKVEDVRRLISINFTGDEHADSFMEGRALSD
jgi:hypothetical protein